MTIQAKALTASAAANSLASYNKRIRSNYDLNVTFGPVAVDETELAVCYPVGFNTTLNKHAPWTAPAPTVVEVDMTDVTAGTWTLTVNGIALSAFAYNITAAAVAEALRTKGHIVTVDLTAKVYTITFDDELDILSPPTVTCAVSGSLAGEASESFTATPGTAVVPDPTTLVIDLGGATGGTFTITVNDVTTAAIAYNADAAAIVAALLAEDIVATAAIDTDITVTFGSLEYLVALPTVSGDVTGLTGDTESSATAVPGTEVVPDPTTLEIDLGSASGGTFTITVGASTTAAIAYNATAEAVVTAVGLISHTVTDVLEDGVHTISFGSLTDLVTLPTVSATLTALTDTIYDITIGTTTYGTHNIVGFVNPEVVTLSDTDDVIGVICTSGVIHYDDIEALVAVGDVTALQTALKNGLVSKAFEIQGLVGVY